MKHDNSFSGEIEQVWLMASEDIPVPKSNISKNFE
jgi:hypothetical protein